MVRIFAPIGRQATAGPAHSFVFYKIALKLFIYNLQLGRRINLPRRLRHNRNAAFPEPHRLHRFYLAKLFELSVNFGVKRIVNIQLSQSEFFVGEFLFDA